MTAIVVALDDSRSIQLTVDKTVQTNEEATALGQGLAQSLLASGAGAVLMESAKGSRSGSDGALKYPWS